MEVLPLREQWRLVGSLLVQALGYLARRSCEIVGAMLDCILRLVWWGLLLALGFGVGAVVFWLR